MKKRVDYIRVVWTCICAVLCIVGAVFFMNAQNAVNRVGDEEIVDRPDVVQPVTNVPKAVVGQTVTAEQRHLDYTEVEKSVEHVATLQNEYAVIVHGWDEKPETYDAWANGIRECADELRAMSSDIGWFVDVWFPWDKKFDDRVHWEGYVDHSDVLTDYIPVVWLCRNDKGEILGYTKAFYGCADGLYSGGTRTYTIYGSAWLAYTDERPVDSAKDERTVLGNVYDILERKGALPPGTNKEDFVSYGEDGDAE